MSTAAMSDLVEFLTARLRDDEQLARSVPGPSWERRQITSTFDESEVFEDYVAVADPERNRVVLSDVDARVLPFALRHDPARVLRDVESKREQVRLAVRCMERWEHDKVTWEGNPPIDVEGRGMLSERNLKLLALPYADHPSFKEEWRV